MDKSGIPLITISNEDNPICYRLPEELSDWALTAIGMANMGGNLFPSQVVFTKEKNRYFIKHRAYKRSERNGKF